MLQSRLIAKRPSFSSVDEHIAQIILSMPYDANMTSTSLAARCEVSQSTIVRFAQKLGYPSFREFLSDYVAFKLAQPNKSNHYASPLKMSLAQENIDYIEAHASSPSFQKTLSSLSEAKQITLVVDELTRLVGEMMVITLQDYLFNVKLVHHASLMSLHHGEVGDVVIFLEGQHSDQLLQAVLLCKHAQFHSILVTQKVNSPLQDYVSQVLHTLPTQREEVLASIEFMHGCLHILVHFIAYLEANNPTLIEARSTFKQRVNAIKALAKHKALD